MHLRLWLYLKGAEPDDHFYTEFKRLAQRRGVETRGDRWGLIELMGANAIAVHQVTPGSEPDLRSALDKLIESANAAAAKSRKAAADAAREDHQLRARGEQTAEEMTERFRSP